MPNASANRLYGGVLTKSVATVFQTRFKTEITLIRVMSLTDDFEADLATIYHVPSGETQGDEHIVYNGNAIVDGAVSIGAGITLRPGDSIQAKATAANAMVLALYGVAESGI